MKSSRWTIACGLCANCHTCSWGEHPLLCASPGVSGLSRVVSVPCFCVWKTLYLHALQAVLWPRLSVHILCHKRQLYLDDPVKGFIVHRLRLIHVHPVPPSLNSLPCSLNSVLFQFCFFSVNIMWDNSRWDTTCYKPAVVKSFLSINNLGRTLLMRKQNGRPGGYMTLLWVISRLKREVHRLLRLIYGLLTMAMLTAPLIGKVQNRPVSKSRIVLIPISYYSYYSRQIVYFTRTNLWMYM